MDSAGASVSLRGYMKDMVDCQSSDRVAARYPWTGGEAHRPPGHKVGWAQDRRNTGRAAQRSMTAHDGRYRRGEEALL